MGLSFVLGESKHLRAAGFLHFRERLGDGFFVVILRRCKPVEANVGPYEIHSSENAKKPVASDLHPGFPGFVLNNFS